MGADHAGDDGFTSRIDFLGIGGDGHLIGWPDGEDGIALHDKCAVFNLGR